MPFAAEGPPGFDREENPLYWLAVCFASQQNDRMAVEHMIGLQAAIGELGELYTVAKAYRPLRAEAEGELLAQTAALGARLRQALRAGEIGEVLVDETARQISTLRDDWLRRLAAMRASPLYQRCLEAWSAGASMELAEALPELLADVTVGSIPPQLYHGVPVNSSRRGGKPFLSPEACTDRVAGYRDQGIVAVAEGSEWWDVDLVFSGFVADPDALDTPVALRLETASVQQPIFTVVDGTYRIYAESLQVPFTVRIRDQVEDEWWQAFDESYAEWSIELAAELQKRGIPLVGAKRSASRD